MTEVTSARAGLQKGNVMDMQLHGKTKIYITAMLMPFAVFSEQRTETYATEAVSVQEQTENTNNTADNYRQTYAERIVAEINRIRNAAGMGTLSLEAKVMTAANIRADEISRCFSHTRPDGSAWWTAGPDVLYGETLAKGFKSPEDTVKAWMNSESHRNVLLHQKYTGIAVGIAYDKNGTVYAAAEFTG